MLVCYPHANDRQRLTFDGFSPSLEHAMSWRRKVVNENYNPATYQNDIALLELSEEVVYRQHIVPVCLPSKGDNFTGKTATVTGWGRTQVSGRQCA